MNEHMQIAHTIREQLMWGGLQKFWCWGGHNWCALPAGIRRLGALQFDVTGMKFQGRVTVELAFSDTYRILLNDKVVASDVYCDMLTDMVDGLVEV